MVMLNGDYWWMLLFWIPLCYAAYAVPIVTCYALKTLATLLAHNLKRI